MQLRRGQIVISKVEEFIAPFDYILSYDGHLIRVSNKTGQSWPLGHKVPLLVAGLNPLEFQLYKKQKTRIDLQA